MPFFMPKSCNVAHYQPQAWAFCLGGAKNRDGTHICNPLQPPCTAKLVTFVFPPTKKLPKQKEIYKNQQETNFLENKKQKPTKTNENQQKSKILEKLQQKPQKTQEIGKIFDKNAQKNTILKNNK